MSSSRKQLEEQIKEAGHSLLKPPTATDELLKLLDVIPLHPFLVFCFQFSHTHTHTIMLTEPFFFFFFFGLVNSLEC